MTSVIHGKGEVVDLALTAVFAGGHVLLQDVPGVGKTTLAAALAAAVGGTFSRIQFTADLLPGDITGVNVFDQRTAEFSFRAGPLFANVVLADEINRTSPKTQSALFEAMEEGAVTVDGQTRALPQPFLVVATQNPYDIHGTFPLPDSQLDRFLMRLTMGYPDRETERQVLRRSAVRRPVPEGAVETDEVLDLLAAAERVVVPEEVEDYVLDLTARTRNDARLLRGVSTRGAQALYRAARALALVQGRGYVVPEDILELAVPVLSHRVLPRIGGGPAGDGGVLAIAAILEELTPPE
ncbi:MAG: AAA family ATPase [Deltaproteobacteria bacterium]|nr:AAA family ATPase [Deltaproteobacteria bacterium]